MSEDRMRDLTRTIDDWSETMTIEEKEALVKHVKKATNIEGSEFFWTYDGMSKVRLSNVETWDELKPACYTVGEDRQGIFLDQLELNTDKLITFEDSKSNEVLKEIKKFWALKKEFKSRGYLHKRGLLMYGEPGSGKSATIHLVAQSIQEQNGVVFFAVDEVDYNIAAIDMIRRKHPDMPIVVVLEDFDNMANSSAKKMSAWLSFLDGEHKVDNILFLATTNYIERIDKRFIDRPSRFDKIIPVDAPSAKVRRAYIESKEPSIKGDELDRWVKDTETFNISHIKELIISVKCMKNSFEDVIENLKEMKKRKFTNEEFNKKNGGSIGFGDDEEDLETVPDACVEPCTGGTSRGLN